MSYFPDSVLPDLFKSESADVPGNQFVVSASDLNKHNSEIIAIEQYLGTSSPLFPTGFSSFKGVKQGSGTTPCSGASGTSIQGALSNLVALLGQIRDGMLFSTSGCVLVYDGSTVPGPTGAKIIFPTDWPMTTLIDPLPDARQNATDPLTNPPYITLADVTNMPQSGYVSIINDVSTMSCQGAGSSRIVHVPGYTSLATSSVPIFSQSNIAAEVNGAWQLSLPATRVFGLGTNMEFIYYDGLDVPNSRILNPQRMQLGTSATAHATPDLVFKGRASINVAPFMFKINNGKTLDCLECCLRSNGTIDLEVRSTDVSPPDYLTQTHYAYAHYSATLIRDMTEIPPYAPTPSQGGCA